MFKKILIANRGEIAIRVAKACGELGIATVGVYSTVDKASLHLRVMDELVWIGDSPPRDSYLNIDAILAAAHKTDAEAIHPGYGFLAENEYFAKACEDAGILFIGPTSKALALVGDKVASRNTVKSVGVPIIPGMHTTSKDTAQFKLMAQKVGYPIMIKASMGGGGKGMRIVHSEKQLSESIAIAQREALSAFGDDSIYLEKYIEQPRHIEFQVLRDHYGNTIHLFERECSIQRRHQKIIEETPSPALDDELRQRMGEAAKEVIAAADYTTAGTVEFLLDAHKQFYFLEVNARIQVEHPITELVTGIDLVRQQILIAAGEEMTLQQDQISQNGHAIEGRIYAEDPESNFMPSPGTILFLSEPGGPGIRVDSGIYQGCTVPPHYDPILSKLIVWGASRKETIARMSHALNDYIILGIKTDIDFLKRILNNPSFISGKFDTGFIDAHQEQLLPQSEKKEIALIAGALNHVLAGAERSAAGYNSQSSAAYITTPWQELGQWEICKL